VSKLRLKICGLRDNVSEVAGLQPDFVGFIFYSRSPRYVGEDFEMPQLDNKIKKVGVFVNEALGEVLNLVDKYQLDYVQLHGNESVEYCRQMKQETESGVMKAFPMDDEFEFDQLQAFEPVVDYFLFDTKTKEFGGSGLVFNWNLLRNYILNKKYFLSGGLSLENVQELNQVDLSKVYALDVNSKFEVKPGLKDIELLKKLKNVL